MVKILNKSHLKVRKRNLVKYNNGAGLATADVASDKAARDEMVSKSEQLSVPGVNINDDILVGFDEE